MKIISKKNNYVRYKNEKSEHNLFANNKFAIFIGIFILVLFAFLLVSNVVDDSNISLVKIIPTTIFVVLGFISLFIKYKQNYFNIILIFITFIMVISQFYVGEDFLVVGSFIMSIIPYLFYFLNFSLHQDCFFCRLLVNDNWPSNYLDFAFGIDMYFFN